MSHHNLLNRLANKFREGLFIIDLHSFAKEVVFPPTANQEYPDICLGYDAKCCDEKTVDIVAKICEKAGYSITINTPYSGSLVPGEVIGNSELSCSSIMVEVNKRLYRINGETDPEAVCRLRRLLTEIAESVR